MQTFDVENEVRAFLAAQAGLSEIKENPWVVFADSEYKGRFSAFEEAYSFASSKFEGGKFLIRQLNAEKAFAPLIYVAA